jgi:NAD(P)-dependent dehydrogenase (short-subunit alcohol dehydrogenase family)
MPTQAKTILVTGASQGLGAGIAGTFLERGYTAEDHRTAFRAAWCCGRRSRRVRVRPRNGKLLP